MDVAINYNVENIAEIIEGKIIQQHSRIQLSHLLLDSRKLLFPHSTIFFALRTVQHSGAEFINNLYEKEVRNFVIDDEQFNVSQYPDATFIVVDNVLHALHLLATHHRKNFSLPVIGITGSNGKTIAKEWLYQLLEADFNIVRSPKSYNSQIGVPLSVLQVDPQCSLAIFEAGISKPGEMEKLEKIIYPGIGIITTIGDAHNEGFESKNQKIKEKLTLFQNSSCLICCCDEKELNNEISILKETNQQIQLFTWGKAQTASLKIISVEKEKSLSLITGTYQGKDLQIKIPFTDNASIQNAITCWCVLLHLQITDKVIAERMLKLHPVEMRLELKHGINNCSVINDSYSADINSLKIALDFLGQQQQHKKQTIILSDILQSGGAQKELYAEVASLLQQKNIDRLIAIGPKIVQHQELFSFITEKHFYLSIEEFKSHFNSFLFRDETILLKGARVFEFEQIDQLLQEKIHQTVLTINLTAITHNLKQYQSLLQPPVKIMAMVKAFSYGSGSYEIANLLQFNNVNYLAVAYADEGVELRKAGITLPIMVMNPEENSFNALVQYNLEPEIFSFPVLTSFERYLNSLGLKNFPVHIKLDTGMHRLGFEQEDIDVLSKHLAGNSKIKVQSVFTHLSASDNNSHDNFTRKQAHIFLDGCEKLQNILEYDFLKHIANTSAISKYQDLQMDMVRLGIGLYGIDVNAKMQERLKNVSSLTTTIAQIKNVKAGESVGYGCETILKKDAVIATVRIGYADGYPRYLSNGLGKMLVQNMLVPVVGNVCMDMTMLDVTGIDCKEGDTVIVFDGQLSIQQIARWCNTIPYEIMTGISQRVKRVYFEE